MSAGAPERRRFAACERPTVVEPCVGMQCSAAFSNTSSSFSHAPGPATVRSPLKVTRLPGTAESHPLASASPRHLTQFSPWT